jgi:prevent-host-death family protein
MVRLVNIYDAKTNLSKLLQEVERGEEILIARAGAPVARLSAVRTERRELGFARDQIWIEDDFDTADESFIREFYG